MKFLLPKLTICNILQKRKYFNFSKSFNGPKTAINKNSNFSKTNILMSEYIGQKRLKFLTYFDAFICHHYQPNKFLKKIKYNKNSYTKNMNKGNNFQQRSKHHYTQMK